MTKNLATWVGFILLLVASPMWARVITLREAIEKACHHSLELQEFQLDKSVRIHELHILKQKYAPSLYYNLALTIQNEDYFHNQFHQKKVHSYPSAKMLTPVGTQIEIFADQNLGYEKNQKSRGQALHVIVEQPLLKGTRKVVNDWSIDNAEMLNEIQELLYTKSLERIIYSVIMQYHVVHLSKENIAFQERWLHQTNRFFDNLKVKVSAGRAPESDLTSSEFEIKQAANYLSQAKLTYIQEMRRLRELIGENDEELDISELAFSQKPTEYDDAVVSTVFENDIESKILNINKIRLKRELLVAKDNERFDLKLRGDWTAGRYHVWGAQDPSDYNDTQLYNYPFVHQSGNYSAQLLLSIPITHKSHRMQQQMSLKIELDKLNLEQQQHEKNLKNLVKGLLEKADLKKEQVTLTRQALTLAQKNYDEAMMKLDAGRASLFEVVTLREKLHDSQMTQQATEIAYLDILANIELTAGLLAKKWLN